MSDLLGRDPDELASALSTHHDYRVIRRYKKPASYSDETPSKDQLKTGIYIDVETTGLDHEADAIIELAMVKFEFTSEGKLFKLGAEYDQLNDPGRPIPEEITRITGITDDMVANQSIDEQEVAAFIDEAVIVIAHNAAFDRKFVEASYSCFEQKAWACSASQINWRVAGFESAKLEYLAYRQGFFYDGHRAVTDCLAGIQVMSYVDHETNRSAFSLLLEEARKKSIRLWAANSPFETKDLLKARGYRWNSGQDGNPKAWFIDLAESEIDGEQQFLAEQVYAGARQLPTKMINAFNRFSARI